MKQETADRLAMLGCLAWIVIALSVLILSLFGWA